MKGAYHIMLQRMLVGECWSIYIPVGIYNAPVEGIMECHLPGPVVSGTVIVHHYLYDNTD